MSRHSPYKLKFVKLIFFLIHSLVLVYISFAFPQALANCYSAIYGLYTNFVGQPHFQSMCRLLDYQDMAVVIRELLQLIKNMVSG